MPKCYDVLKPLGLKFLYLCRRWGYWLNQKRRRINSIENGAELLQGFVIASLGLTKWVTLKDKPKTINAIKWA
jgi:hypothetical protein